MVRTQVQLTEEQMRKLRREAAKRGVSLAEVVRVCIDRAFAQDAPDRRQLYARAARLIGAFEDREQATDLSAAHDRYLEEAFD